MAIQTRSIQYADAGATLHAYMAWDDQYSQVRPGVLVCHDAMGGGTAFEQGRAQALATMGYVGFALDVYGDKQRASNAGEAYQLMTPFSSNRARLRLRLHAALSVLSQQPEVDAEQLASIGYCFGGLCSLELARAGMAVKGVASFHGSLAAAEGMEADTIDAKILAMHGWQDPIVPVEEVLGFTHEMTAANADWQLITYGEAMHSFTNPAANRPDQGVMYNECVERRSWQALQEFLAEIFSP